MKKKLTKYGAKKIRRKARLKAYLLKVPKDYFTYINSPAWEKRKRQYFSLRKKICEVCGSRNSVQLHHKFYGARGAEEDKHLVALCSFHHEQLHLALGKTKKDMIQETNDLVEEMKNYDKRLKKQLEDPFLN